MFLFLLTGFLGNGREEERSKLSWVMRSNARGKHQNCLPNHNSFLALHGFSSMDKGGFKNQVCLQLDSTSICVCLLFHSVCVLD